MCTVIYNNGQGSEFARSWIINTMVNCTTCYYATRLL